MKMRAKREVQSVMRGELSDEEWLQFEAVLPKQKRRSRGRPRSVNLRGVVDAICYLARTGCSWRDVPSQYGYWYTCYRYFQKWSETRVWYKIQKLLHRKYRVLKGFNKYPDTLRIDSQFVKTGRTVPKKSKSMKTRWLAKGRKRHIAVESTGIPVAIAITKATEYDGNVGMKVMSRAMKYVNQRGFKKIYADGHYRGDFVKWCDDNLGIEPIITTGLSKVDDEFKPTKGRWVVEQTFAHTDNYRRLSIDRENKPLHSKCMVRVAAISMLLKRISRLVERKRLPSMGNKLVLKALYGNDG